MFFHLFRKSAFVTFSLFNSSSTLLHPHDSHFIIMAATPNITININQQKAFNILDANTARRLFEQTQILTDFIGTPVSTTRRDPREGIIVENRQERAQRVPTPQAPDRNIHTPQPPVTHFQVTDVPSAVAPSADVPSVDVPSVDAPPADAPVLDCVHDLTKDSQQQTCLHPPQDKPKNTNPIQESANDVPCGVRTRSYYRQVEEVQGRLLEMSSQYDDTRLTPLLQSMGKIHKNDSKTRLESNKNPVQLYNDILPQKRIRGRPPKNSYISNAMDLDDPNFRLLGDQFDHDPEQD